MDDQIRGFDMKCKYYEDNVFKEYACRCEGEMPPVDCSELQLLKLKDLLLSKEYEIQVGRLDLEKYGQWQTNHGEIIDGINQEIDFLYQKIEGRI